MELIKETKNYNKKLLEQYIPVYTETDTIVPDVKPDMVEIMSDDANVWLVNKTINNGKITFELEALINVLYKGDDDKVHSMSTTHNFRQTVDSRFDLDEVKVVENIANKHIETILINSRKLGIRLSVGLEITFYQNQEIECITDFDESDIEKKIKSISANLNDYVGCGELTAKNIMEIPTGKPSINEVLQADSIFTPEETKSAGNKVLIKGELKTKLLYIADDQTINTIENAFPVSEIITIDKEIDSETNLTPSFNLGRVGFMVQADEDGENRLISIDNSIKASFTQNKQINFDLVEDAFSTKHDIDLEYKTVTIPSTNFEKEENFAMVEVLQPNEQVTSLYNVKANSKTLSKQIENGNLNLNGEIEITAIYLNENSLRTIKKTVSFERTVYIGDLEDADVKETIENLIYDTNIAGEIEVRANIKILISSQNEQQIEYLTGADYKEEEEERGNRPYSMRIYYVKDDDTPWNIAKKYRVKIDDLIEENGENLYTGQKLLIQG